MKMKLNKNDIFQLLRPDFIQMEYYVHAVARTHSFYDDIVVKLPIVIVGDKVTRCKD